VRFLRAEFVALAFRRFGYQPVRRVPDCEVLAALVPERVLPFASGGSRKRGPGRVGFPAHDRGGAPKGERPAYRAAAAPAHRGAATVGAPFGAPPPSLGSKDVLGSKDIASRPFEASFLGKQDPDAIRIAAMQFRVVIAGLSRTRDCGDDWMLCLRGA
jgi:hypothetical protein